MIKIGCTEDIHEEVKKDLNILLCKAYSYLEYMDGIEISQDYMDTTPDFIDKDTEKGFIIENPDDEVFGKYYKYLCALESELRHLKQKYPTISIYGRTSVRDKHEGVHVLEFKTKSNGKYNGELYVDYEEDEDSYNANEDAENTEYEEALEDKEEETREEELILWGTSSPIHFVEPILGVPLELNAFGKIKVAVSDESKLSSKLMENPDRFHNEIIRKVVSKAVILNLASAIKNRNIDIVEVNKHLHKLSKELELLIVPYFEEFGITILEFYLSNIFLPEGDCNYRRLREFYEITMQKKRIMHKMRIENEEIEEQLF